MNGTNEKEIRKHWNELSSKAIPKNSAWRHLEDLNFDADFDEKDYGEYFNER
jgi:hypothetical protein